MTLKFGLAIMNDFPPDVVPATRIGQLREQVRTASAAGFGSIWVLQHYLGRMPTLQPLPLLAALAHDATPMSLGTNMFILPLRHPVEVAEEFSTLDHISGGRAIAGFGLGYRENEFASFGVPLSERKYRFEESIALIRGLWSGAATTHAGRFYQLDEQSISLAPVQPGGPPIWVGAGPHRAGAQRAARLGDGWIVPPHVGPDQLEVLLRQYQAECTRLGDPTRNLILRRELVLDRDPERAQATGLRARGALTAEYARYNAPQQGAAYRHLANADAAREVADAAYLFTDPAGAIAALKELETLGITHVILRAQWYGLQQDEVLRTLELFASEVLPQFR